MRDKIEIDNLEEHQKYYSIILDEIQIKQDLVFKSSTGELIGAKNLNHYRNKITELEHQINSQENLNENLNLADHVLQLMVRGLTTNFKFPYAFFPCGNLHAEDLYSIIWEAVENLHGAGFRILSIVCDKASSNMKLIKLCTASQQQGNNDRVGYQTKNPFSGEQLYFVLDVCHNMKTAKTALTNSGRQKKRKDGSVHPIRLLKKNGQLLLWKHIEDTYEIDSKSLLRLAPKLTYNHVYPNAHSCMRVGLATQVMSSTTANAVEKLIGEEAKETVKFLRLFDTFFDMLNISNTFSFYTKKKPALEPFKSLNDHRFNWLMEEFLGYLDEWETEVNEMEVEPEFDKSKMLFSRETLLGLRISVFGTIDIIKFLLKKGAPYMLTAKLNQDLVENYFRKQRGSCGSGENPTVDQYGQGTKRIKLMKSLLPKVKNSNCTQKKRAERRKLARDTFREQP